MNCENCDLLKQKETEVAELRKTQDLLFLLLKSGLIAVEQWAGEGAFLGSENQQKMVHVTGKNNASPLDRENLAEQIRTLLKAQINRRGTDGQGNVEKATLSRERRWPNEGPVE